VTGGKEGSRTRRSWDQSWTARPRVPRSRSRSRMWFSRPYVLAASVHFRLQSLQVGPDSGLDVLEKRGVEIPAILGRVVLVQPTPAADGLFVWRLPGVRVARQRHPDLLSPCQRRLAGVGRDRQPGHEVGLREQPRLQSSDAGVVAGASVQDIAVCVLYLFSASNSS